MPTSWPHAIITLLSQVVPQALLLLEPDRFGIVFGNLQFHKKLKITAWRVATGVLPTEQCKRYRHLSKRSTCPLCGVEEESTFHVLVVCPHARLLWVNMRTRWPLPCDDFLIDNAKEWLMDLLNSCSDDVHDMRVLLIWRVWDMRNDQTHGKESPPVLASVEFLDNYYKSIKLVG